MAWPDFLDLAQQELRSLAEDGYEVRPERLTRGQMYVAYVRGDIRIEVYYDMYGERTPNASVARAGSGGFGVPGTYQPVATQSSVGEEWPTDPDENAKSRLGRLEERRLRDFCQRLLCELRQRGLTS
jgi:hypothetical protein